MSRVEDPGGALEDVERIHPVVDRLRRLLASATLLDIKATTEGYWADGRGERDAARRLRKAETA